jgi:hypothetical protein
MGGEDQYLSAGGLSRREFLIRSAALGISVASLTVLLNSCRSIASPAQTTNISPTSPQPSSSHSITQASPSITRPGIQPSPNPSISSTSPQPSPSLSNTSLSDDLKIRHLLRRAGFGANQNEIKNFTDLGLSATIDYLLEYQNVDDSALEDRLTSLNLDQTKLSDIQRWWSVRMIYTKRPLLEKMVLFWHGILTSGISKVGSAQFMFNQNQR